MMRVNREELLRRLRSVQAGIAAREFIEQTSCFVFQKGMIRTYNDEITCSYESGLDKDFKGAIVSDPLLKLLEGMKEEEIQIDVAETEIKIKGKKRGATLLKESKITMPLDALEDPGEWKKLNSDFAEAIEIVKDCAGKDETKFYTTCVHIEPTYVEAFDNYQACRFNLKTRISENTLVRANSIKHILPLGMTHVSETSAWLHFKNPSGLVLSCRKYNDQYQDLNSFLEVEGKPMGLPKGLIDATKLAEIFSKENVEKNEITVDLMPGQIRIKGKGISGRYSEVKKVKYAGKPHSFIISPGLLAQIVAKHNECVIGKRKLKVDGGSWAYIALLGKVEEGEE